MPGILTARRSRLTPAAAVIATAPTVRSVATSSTNTVPKPTGAVAGDTLYVVHGQGPFWSDTDMVAPSGWSTADLTVTTNSRIKVWHKRLTSGDDATTTWTWGEGGASAYVAIAVPGAHATTPTDVTATGGGTSTTHVAPSVTTTGANRLLLCGYTLFTGSSPRTWTGPGGMTALGAIDNTQAIAVYSEARPTASATGTRTATGTQGNDGYASFTLAIAPP